MDLPAKIKQARIEKGLTQAELAEKIGVEPPSVSRWEGGEMAPRPKMIHKIAEALEVGVEWLMSPAADQKTELKPLLDRIKALEDNARLTKSPKALTLSSGEVVTLDELYDALLKIQPDKRDHYLRAILASGKRDTAPAAATNSPAKTQPLKAK